MSRYWKSIIAASIAIAVTVVQAVQVAVADEAWSLDDTLTVLLVFLGTAGVYFKANVPPDGGTSDPGISEVGESTVDTIVGVTFLLLVLAVVVALVLGRLLLLIL